MDGTVETIKASLPLPKVKSTCKLDPDTGPFPSQAVQPIDLATVSPLHNSKSHENAVKKEVTERNKGVKGEVKESHEDTAKDEANESRKFGTTDEVISPE
ncbi:unnamed protein product [Enterobius vermicularis]|uniref:Uncharacterized protein n=1 Tax=Enterobius vermicularis TaxID=51028 RepID=A0A0N4V994_ENTVE|nr:unnamed protein product [Enterobius vermicularis]